MSLARILVLSNVLDPTNSLESVFDAFRALDAEELKERALRAQRECEPERSREAQARRMAAAFWN